MVAHQDLEQMLVSPDFLAGQKMTLQYFRKFSNQVVKTLCDARFALVKAHFDEAEKIKAKRVPVQQRDTPVDHTEALESFQALPQPGHGQSDGLGEFGFRPFRVPLEQVQDYVVPAVERLLHRCGR